MASSGSTVTHAPSQLPTGIDILPFIADSVICTDETGRIFLFNGAAEKSFGYSSSEVFGEQLSILLPERYRLQHAEQVIKFASEVGTADRLMGAKREVWGRRKDGSEFAAEATISRHTLNDDVILTVVHRDITEKKELEQQREVIAHELDHRIKNVISVVSALVSLTAKNVGSVEEFRDSLQDRLHSLAATQSFLSRYGEKSISLRALMLAELGQYQSQDGTKIKIDCPNLALRSSAVQPLALVLHELATNSAKYGALSKSGGCVRIATELANDGDDRLLAIEWVEAGGPTVKAPERQGFGHHLIEQMVKRVFLGEVEIEFRPEGLVCRMALPTTRVEDNLADPN